MEKLTRAHPQKKELETQLLSKQNAGTSFPRKQITSDFGVISKSCEGIKIFYWLSQPQLTKDIFPLEGLKDNLFRPKKKKKRVTHLLYDFLELKKHSWHLLVDVEAGPINFTSKEYHSFFFFKNWS